LNGKVIDPSCSAQRNKYTHITDHFHRDLRTARERWA